MPRMSRSGPLLLITGTLYALFGLVLLVGGGRLLLLGGSAYYLLVGAGLVDTGILLVKARREALWLYAWLLVGTTVWAVVEVHFDRWQLLPRLDVWFVLGLWLWLPFVNRRLRAQTDQRDVPFSTARWALGGAVVLVSAVGVASLLQTSHDVSGELPAAQMNASGSAAAPFTAPDDWTAFGHSGFADRYAPARQITPQNVHQLQVAWDFPVDNSADAAHKADKVSLVTPLKVNGMLYLCTPRGEVVALDPDTGKVRWRFAPKIRSQTTGASSADCRGIAYHDSGAYFEPGAAAWLPTPTASVAAPVVVPKGAVAVSAIHFDECPRRIFVPSADATIVAVNADTGKRCESFGDHGAIRLNVNQPTDQSGFLTAVSAPLATRHVLLVNAADASHGASSQARRTLRGYDVESGELLWSEDVSGPSASASMASGQRNALPLRQSWGLPSVDERLGLLYVSLDTQAAMPDGRFSSSIVALDITTGQRRWAYQTVNDDVWNMGADGQPSLLNLDRASGVTPALLASTKRGDIYVLDRRDGKLLVPAAQRAVPQEAASKSDIVPTQRVSTLNYTPNMLRERDMWGATPVDQLLCRITFKKYRYDGASTSPSARASIVYPGGRGVFGRSGIAVDPVRQVALLTLDYTASLQQLPAGGAASVDDRQAQSKAAALAATQLQPMLSPLGMSCQAPPRSYVAALNLKTMRTVWLHKSDSAGAAFAMSGSRGILTTGAGIAFVSGTREHGLRAYDVRNGNLLWQSRLAGSDEAPPMSFVSDKTGRQYVVVMTRSHDLRDDKAVNALVAYAVPSTTRNVAIGK